MKNNNYPEPIQKLIDYFVKFPGVGPKTAARFVFYLLETNNSEIKELPKAISELKNSLKVCKFCFKFFETNGGLCEICADRSRDKNTLCIIEKQTDLASIEKNKIYKGLYFILGATISNLKEENIKKLRIEQLENRIKNPEKFGMPDVSLNEIILALNPTVDGEATALYLERTLKPLNKKITRLGRGLPAGGELEYADIETIRSAFERRK